MQTFPIRTGVGTEYILLPSTPCRVSACGETGGPGTIWVYPTGPLPQAPHSLDPPRQEQDLEKSVHTHL